MNDEKVMHPWPAVMRIATLKRYLDCQDARNWRAMKIILTEAGYEGINNRWHRKDLVDEALRIAFGGKKVDPTKKRLLEQSK